MLFRSDYMVKKPFLPRKLSKKEVFLRDRFTCQYCGKKAQDLTLDHVVPRRQHGSHTWENVVAACNRCNLRKAGRTPAEANMLLKRNPGHRTPIPTSSCRTARFWMSGFPMCPGRHEGNFSVGRAVLIP